MTTYHVAYMYPIIISMIYRQMYS